MFLFFFFKQKTAYEMRISDWSSDVCSSDLDQRDHGADRVDDRRPGLAHARPEAAEAEPAFDVRRDAGDERTYAADHQAAVVEQREHRVVHVVRAAVEGLDVAVTGGHPRELRQLDALWHAGGAAGCVDHGGLVRLDRAPRPFRR